MENPERFAAALLISAPAGYAAGAVERLLKRRPEAVERLGGFQTASVETEQRLRELAAALQVARPQLFLHEVGWQKATLAARGIPGADLEALLACVRAELAESLPREAAGAPTEILEEAVDFVAAAPDILPSGLGADGPEGMLARRFLLAVLEGRGEDGVQLVLDAAAEGLGPEEIHRALVRVQSEIGRMWQAGEVHVAEEHLATQVVRHALARLKPVLQRGPAPGGRAPGRVLLAGVSGDLHDVGLQLLADAFELDGWHSLLLGANTPAIDCVMAVGDFGADLLAVSAHLSVHVPAVEELVRSLRASSAGRDVPVLVGGPPFDSVPDLWRLVGADASASDPSQALAVARRLVAARRGGPAS